MIPIPWMTMIRMIHLMMKKKDLSQSEKAESVLNVAVVQGAVVVAQGAVVVAQGVGGEEVKVIHAAVQETAEAVSVVSSAVVVTGESVYADLKLPNSLVSITSLMSSKLSIKWLDTSRLCKLICKFL